MEVELGRLALGVGEAQVVVMGEAQAAHGFSWKEGEVVVMG